MNKQTYASLFGYVYLLKCGDHFKIGFSKTPRKRLRQLRTGSPLPITVEHQLKTPHFRAVEQQLHIHFRNKRGNGEWFTLSEDDVSYIKSLDQYGDTPEEVREKEDADAQYWAVRNAEQKAEETRRLGILLSGAASGVGDCHWLE